MIVRGILPLVLFAVLFVCEGRKWKQSCKRELIVYGVMLLGAVYLSLIYVFEKQWPNLNDLIGFFFTGPSKRIVEFFSPSA